MILSDKEIIKRAKDGMIEPFEKKLVKQVKKKRVLSYGVSSYGYDIRLADEFRVFVASGAHILDPKNMPNDTTLFVEKQEESCVIPAHGFILARSLEYIRMPRDLLAICMGKSTYARCGLIVNVTPLEPEWEGHITIEISNTSPVPVRVHANEGIAQLIFLKADKVCGTSYKDRGGKYQGQRGITTAKV